MNRVEFIARRTTHKVKGSDLEPYTKNESSWRTAEAEDGRDEEKKYGKRTVQKYRKGRQAEKYREGREAKE